MFQRVRSQLKTPADVWLAARMALWACCLPLLKHVVPLPALVRFVAIHRQLQPSPSLNQTHQANTTHPTCLTHSTSVSPSPRNEELLAHIVTLARWSCRLTRWSTGGNCLERGLVTYRFLGAADFEPSFVAGFRRSEDGDLRGHAWVVVDGSPVGESTASLADFERAIAFGPEGLALDRKPAFS